MTKSVTELAGNRGETDDLTEADRCRLLSSARRRTALDVLVGRTAPVDLDDLAREIATRERDGDVTSGKGDVGERGNGVDARTVERVAVSLHHVHLPKMADLGVVDYDSAANRVESCPDCADGPTD